MVLRNDTAPIPASEARQLFSPWKDAPAIVVAVSGGPDSTALLWLIARWRKALRHGPNKGPKLLAVTVDHGLRAESAAEARAVAKLAASLGVAHRTLRWRGAKPETGLQAAARDARYRLLAAAAKRAGASHIMTAHSHDDQAETVLMRLSRGSGLSGLGGMSRETILPFFAPPPAERRGGVGGGGRERSEPILLARPLLDIPKARLLATLDRHRVPFADDASNRDPRFTRVRWRGLLPSLSEEGLDARNLARLARRAARADAALELATLGAERALVRKVEGKIEEKDRLVCDRAGFLALPDEIRLRLLGRMIARLGGEGPVELGKLEAMLDAVNGSLGGRGGRLRRSLAGAVVAVDAAGVAVERAPARRAVTKGP